MLMGRSATSTSRAIIGIAVIQRWRVKSTAHSHNLFADWYWDNGAATEGGRKTEETTHTMGRLGPV